MVGSDWEGNGNVKRICLGEELKDMECMGTQLPIALKTRQERWLSEIIFALQASGCQLVPWQLSTLNEITRHYSV